MTDGLAFVRDCTTCRWHRYLITLDEHLCHHPDSSGHIAESDVYNTGCPGWEPMEVAA